MRERPLFFHASPVDVPADISLKLGQIAGAPCTENRIRAAPGKEIPEDFRESPFSVKIPFRHMDYASRHMMQPFIEDRLNNLMKAACRMKILIHFNGSDFYNLKGKHRIFPFFPIRTLVPFQVQNNVVHKFAFCQKTKCIC